MPPLPKPLALRQRKNRSSTAATLRAPDVARIPLPNVRWSSTSCNQCPLARWHHTRRKFLAAGVEPHDFDADVLDWHPTTLAWWETIWESPMADEWVDADVPALTALAVLVDEFFRTGEPRIHAEIRMAQREFGLTPMSRRSLQWEIRRMERPRPPERPWPSVKERVRAKQGDPRVRMLDDVPPESA